MVAAGEYLREHYRDQVLFDPKGKKHYNDEMFHGYDMDRTMLRIGAMNMMTHGVENPDIQYKDSLSEQNADTERYSLILANIWSPSRISPLRSPMVSRCPLPGFQQICSQMSTAWSDGPVDSWEHICYRIPEGATDLKYPYATYHV